MSRKVVLALVAILAIYALVQAPTQSANLVQRSATAVGHGASRVLDGLFTFVNALV